MKKKIFKTVLALLLALFWIFALFSVQALITPKYQSGVIEGSMIAEYYKDKTEHDVIMVGDCEIYEVFSPVELWNKYGITSYLRGSAQQLAWQSYYLLEDSFRTEKPKVAVFNVQSLKHAEPQKEAYNRMTIDGMRWSTSKIGAIKASMTKDESFFDYLFPMMSYHTRWSELTDEDFAHIYSKDNVTYNGYYLRADVRPFDEFPDPTPLPDYTLGSMPMSYLEKMEELCRENGVKLVLVKAPIEYPHWYSQWDRQVVEFAEKHGLDYINFIDLKNEIGLDMSKDTYDAGLHLNVYGAEKMSDYFGKWLVDNCALEDHRSDEKLSAYYSDMTERYENEKISQQREFEEYGKIISRAPAEVKETNVLKNFIVLLVLAAICITLAACNPSKTTDDSTSSQKPSENQSVTAAPGTSDSTVPSAIKPASDGFKMIFKDYEIVLSQNMKDAYEKLGEPKKYFESESCAYQGLDKVYNYGSVVINTFPEKGEDYILSIVLKDDSVSTPEGVSIGDSAERVSSVYGAPSSTAEGSSSYSKGGTTLSFIFEDGSVSAITYMLDQ